MNTILPGTCFTVIEAGDIQIKTSHIYERNKFFTSICDNYKRHADWWEKTELVLKQSSSIATRTGLASLYAIHQSNHDFKEYLSLYLSCPAVFRSFETWALFQAVQETELKFLETCSKPNNEVALSSALLCILNIKSELVQEKYQKILSITGSMLNVKKLELQVLNREKKVGGDFALLFEWKDESGTIKICPVIFQAKRVTSLDANISQHNKKSGYQFNALSKSKCNPVYIFYNCHTSDVAEIPRLSTIKRVSDIDQHSSPSKTSTVEQALSFSVFIIDIMSSNKYFTTSSRKTALNEILVGVNETELSNIVTFSVDPSALRQYESEYKKYLDQKTLENNRNNDSDGFTP